MTDPKPAAWIGVGLITGNKFAALDDEPRSDFCGPWEPLYDRAALDAAVAAERERCAKVCDEEAAGFGGCAEGRMATERGKLVFEAMAAGAMNCAAAIRAEPKE